MFLWVPAFVGLIWLIDGAESQKAAVAKENRRRFAKPGWAAFGAGWWFGVGFFGAGLYWISLPFLVDARQFAWMIPFALLGMAAGLGLFAAVAAWASLLGARPGLQRVVLFAVWWVALEWVRSWLFTGFPWNYVGTSWTFAPAMLQVAALTGVYGLSFLTVLAASLPALLGDRDVLPARRWMALGAAFVLMAGIWGGGAARLAGAIDDPLPNVRLRLVQPNIRQRDKWQPQLMAAHMRNLLSLSTAPSAADGPTHVIWPETAIPAGLETNRTLRDLVAGAAPPGGAIITGAPRVVRAAGRPTRVWNSLYAIEPGGRLAATYDKAHLVPFGEYVPFRNLLPLTKLTAGRLDFSPGAGRRAITVAGLPPVSPLICYEVTYPGRVVPNSAPGARRPAWLLNLTNDAWFGNSSGPYQHFASARLRAVEEGMPLVRVANTGISAVVDSYGRVVAALALGQRGVLDSGLPRALDRLTPYARFGNWTVFLLLLLSATGGWLLGRAK